MGKKRRSLADVGRSILTAIHDETKLASLIYREAREQGREMDLQGARAIARILRADLLPSKNGQP